MTAERGHPHPASRIATRRVLVGILGFAAISRVLYFLAYRSDPFASFLLHDARRYHDWATALTSGPGWEAGAFYQAPLYPYLIAAIYGVAGPRPVAVYVLQLVLGVLAVLFVFRVARRAYGSRAGLAAAGIASLYGVFVFYETKLLPASLAVFLAVLLVDRMQAADRSRRDLDWLGAGVVAGAAALANPSFLLMGVLGVVWIAVDRSRPLRGRAMRIVGFAVGVGLLVAPVAARNHRESGEWVLISANGGLTFYQGNNPNSLGVFSSPPGLSASIFEQREQSRSLAQAATGRSMGDGEVSGYWFRQGLGFIGSDPVHWAWLLGRKFLLTLATEEQPLEYNVGLDENPYRWFMPLPFAVVLALAAVRVYSPRGGGRGSRAEHPILMLVLTGGVTLLVFYVSGRYRLPTMPALAALAGCGAVALTERLGKGVRAVVAPLLTAALVAAFSFAYVSLAHGELRGQQTAMSLKDRARALWDAGHRDDAVEAMRRSIALDPVLPQRHLDLGRLLVSMGRVDEAEHSIREALRLDPVYAEAHFALGLLCIDTGRPEQAASAFMETFRLDPTNENAANNLLGLWIHLGRTAEAEAVWREIETRGLAVDPSLAQAMRSREP